MRERKIVLLLASVLGVVFCGCASNSGPQLPYPYGAPQPVPPANGQPVPPTNGQPVPPTNGQPIPPANSQFVPPASSQSVAPPPPTPGAGPAFPSLKRPSWRSPGTIQQQRQLATQFDPYGDNDAGPAIEGGRPREFARPQAQAARSSSIRSRFIPLTNPPW